ncbi:hypothetical protein PFICI_10299 [Pestalotiopsis fici W106-1]|uniref:Zn(2)-C6 fungal-type domain-containing protein n=1 Tax=Pestalotiopsis fici (strain W106-1 / CGMCC3.15140) TaxID=1229662 RepID=W3WYR7_PESFW|nr:uncharacterized protein PFICI_10299 [Pestalotiopsis fici W106-1]ETS78237.1 hypothetical protein PFICI_10299 [Pestalotiopsis fici W106-1]
MIKSDDNDASRMNTTLEHQNRCGLCNKTFRQKSSLIRHAKKCTLEPKTSVRQKACKACTTAKARCDLARPACSRCAGRGAACIYVRPPPTPGPSPGSCSDVPLPTVAPSSAVSSSASSAHGLSPYAAAPQQQQQQQQAMSSSSTTVAAAAAASLGYDFASLDTSHHGALTPGFFSSSEDGLEMSSFLDAGMGLDLLHTTPSAVPHPSPSGDGLDEWSSQSVGRPGPHGGDAVLKHSMRTIFRVLRSWPRMLAKEFQLPPIIHPLQFKEGTPRPLANCIALCKIWSGQCDASVGPGIGGAVREELEVIFNKHRTYDQPTLLAALQSVVIYLLLLIFPTPSQTSQSLIPPSLLNQIQALGHHVAATGLILHEETARAVPVWTVWAHVEAKRRSMCALHLAHWAYSVYHGPRGARYDGGRELARMPGPGAKFLWNAADERAWATLYGRWLAQWDEGRDFMFADFVGIDPEVVMNRRAEIWLEDADELGFLMLSLVNATERNMSRVMNEV